MDQPVELARCFRLFHEDYRRLCPDAGFMNYKFLMHLLLRYKVEGGQEYAPLFPLLRAPYKREQQFDIWRTTTTGCSRPRSKL